MVGMGATGHILIERKGAHFRGWSVIDCAGDRDTGLQWEGGRAVAGKVGHLQRLVDDRLNGANLVIFQ